jgi:hypothetical protein
MSDTSTQSKPLTSELILETMTDEEDLNIHEIVQKNKALEELTSSSVREQLKRLAEKGLLVITKEPYGRSATRYIHADNYIPPVITTPLTVKELLATHKPDIDLVTSSRWCDYDYRIGFC